MASANPPFLFQDALLLALVLPLAAVVSWGLLTVLGWAGLSRLSRRTERAIVVCVVVVVPWVPMRLLQVVTQVVMWVLAAFLAYFLLLVTPWARRVFLAPRIRAANRRILESGLVFAPVAQAPRGLEERTRALQSLGFERVVVVMEERSRAISSFLVRRADGVIAMASQLPRRYPRLPNIVMGLTSVVEGRRGTLATSNLGLRGVRVPTHLAQIFPDATPAFLSAAHEEARVFLQERGVRFQPVEADQVLDIIQWAERETASALQELSDDELVSRQIARQPVSFLEELDEAALSERIRPMVS
jgi:hypothetical protein